ncbi:hypothetical protein D1AOALGA4SA_12310 [Olavius algarvensis Delta 1 endosymbiont]|nr:hypothetical protein D1AOALGA4SA_12310 [Olavius algarvensis Delta 1 endosymbiont]
MCYVMRMKSQKTKHKLQTNHNYQNSKSQTMASLNLRGLTHFAYINSSDRKECLIEENYK